MKREDCVICCIITGIVALFLGGFVSHVITYNATIQEVKEANVGKWVVNQKGETSFVFGCLLEHVANLDLLHNFQTKEENDGD